MAVKRAADSWGVKLKKRSARAKTASLILNETEVVLVLPQTFMNRSGIVVKAIMAEKQIPLERTVVIFDDLDIDLGEIRVRRAGSPGTHNGLRSIVRETGGRNFPRIRIGIGPLPPDEDATDFVLAPFDRAERAPLDQSLEAAEEALGLILSDRSDRAMALFNRKKKAL
jgi:PTH1 family peptidyl-tRNA hydrolase